MNHKNTKKNKNNKYEVIDLTTTNSPPSKTNSSNNKNPIIIDLTDTTTTTVAASPAITKEDTSINIIKQKDNSLSKPCPICLLELRDPAATWCGHLFCWKCIRRAQKSMGCCPVCREPLSCKQYHRIYL